VPGFDFVLFEMTYLIIIINLLSMRKVV
jgi:hypothetical protein